MSNLSRSVLVVSALLCASSGASAFSVSNHIQITNAAVDQVRACVNKHPGRWDHLRGVDLPGRSNALVACNVIQDDLERKFTMWHFPKRGERIRGTPLQGNWLAASTSFDAYFDTVATRLSPTADVDRVYPALGALLHYLQDVALPAHAIPIFHPSPLWNGDNLDGFPLQPEPPLDDVQSCERMLEHGGAQAMSMTAILSYTMNATLRAVQSPIPDADISISGRDSVVEKVPKYWTLFWSLKRERDGFGNYGCVGNAFGETEPKCWFWGTANISIERRAYVEFARTRQRAAIEASAQAIAYALRAKPIEHQLSETLLCPVPYSEHAGRLQVCDQAVTGTSAQNCSSEFVSP